MAATDEQLLRKALAALEAVEYVYGSDSHACSNCGVANGIDEHDAACELAHALVALRHRLGKPTRVVEPRAPWLLDGKSRYAVYESECPLCRGPILKRHTIVLMQPLLEPRRHDFEPVNPAWAHIHCTVAKGYGGQLAAFQARHSG